jgi:hypothetical protein
LLIFLVVIFGIAMIACDTGENEVPEKYEGPVWTTVDDSPFHPLRGGILSETQNINAITYGEGVFVAGGERSLGSNIAWSNNGNNWTLVVDDDNPFSYQKVSFSGESGEYSVFRNINAIAYGDGKFVAGGDNGQIAWSNDGEDWTIVDDSKFGSETISAVAYGGGKFVVGGSNGQIAWSNDGEDWTLVDDSTFGSEDRINAIAFAVLGQTGRFIAVSNSGKMALSPDAVSWSAIADTSFGSNSIYDITYGGGKFVAVGSSSHVAWSDFGLSWIGIEKSGNSLSSVVYGDGKFVACGTYGLAISPDGITWTDVPDQDDGNISAFAIAYGNGKFVIGGWDGKIAYSD